MEQENRLLLKRVLLEKLLATLFAVHFIWVSGFFSSLFCSRENNVEKANELTIYQIYLE